MENAKNTKKKELKLPPTDPDGLWVVWCSCGEEAWFKLQSEALQWRELFPTCKCQRGNNLDHAGGWL